MPSPAELSVRDIATRAHSVAARRSQLLGLYAFGSRIDGSAHAASDVDLGAVFEHRASLEEVIGLENELEEALGVSVDLVDAGRCEAFLALEVVRGERIYTRPGAEYEMDSFDLYVLRRAGDLWPFEKERRRLLLGFDLSESP